MSDGQSRNRSVGLVISCIEVHHGVDSFIRTCSPSTQRSDRDDISQSSDRDGLDDEEARIMDGDPVGGIVELNCRRCPRTAALLRSIPEVAGLAQVQSISIVSTPIS